MHRSRYRYVMRGMIILCAAFVFFFALHAFAQVSIDLPTNFAGFSSQSLKTTIENIVRIVLGFVGFIFLLLIMYGGFVWMLSAGDERKISQAKKIIVSAVVGLIITLSAYAIASFIIRSFGVAVNNGGGGPGGGPGGYGYALGGGVLESHYPARNASDVPRNTNIYVTFKEAMNVATICSGISVNSANVKITEDQNKVPADANDTDNDNLLEGVGCASTSAANTTFKFDPPANLGLNSENVVYKVTLTTAIETVAAPGRPAMPYGYNWQFTVGTVIDTTPPRVTSVIPYIASSSPRNSLVQINFSEPVDPSLASGLTSATPPFDNITVTDTTTNTIVEGSYLSGNQYRTTEFVSNDLCGQNSCGGNVYCLPGPTVPVLTLALDGVVTTDITDMANNQLDQDPVTPLNQDFTWQFETNDTIDLSPPLMTTRTPVNTSIGADLSLPVEAEFDKVLSSSSVNSSNAGLSRGAFTDDVPFWVYTQNIDTNGDNVADVSKIIINHDTFTPLIPYHPGVSSNIKDTRQNCYFPAACDADGDGVADASCSAF